MRKTNKLTSHRRKTPLKDGPIGASGYYSRRLGYQAAGGVLQKLNR